MKFKPGNIFPLAAWFIVQHGLSLLKKFLFPEVVVAYALQTSRYSFDESVLSGKNGGHVMDAHRAHAYFRLLTDPEARKNVTLVATVLYGQAQNQEWNDTLLEEEARVKGLPTPAEIALCYDLDRAKALCNGKRAAPIAAAEKPIQRHGRAIVLDFLSMSASADAAKLMRDAGLHVTTRFAFSQLPNLCGYLSAGWAVMLRALGLDFAELDMATAAAINTPPFAHQQNTKLDIDDPRAIWLSDDQILKLAHIDNPDQPNTPPTWLHGPAPINYSFAPHFSTP